MICANQFLRSSRVLGLILKRSHDQMWLTWTCAVSVTAWECVHHMTAHHRSHDCSTIDHMTHDAHFVKPAFLNCSSTLLFQVHLSGFCSTESCWKNVQFDFLWHWKNQDWLLNMPQAFCFQWALYEIPGCHWSHAHCPSIVAMRPIDYQFGPSLLSEWSRDKDNITNGETRVL